MEATTAGSTLIVEENTQTAWTNASDGVISATDGVLELGGAFTNAGQITLSDAILYLDADYGYGSQFQTFVNTGAITGDASSVNITGDETRADLGTITLTNGRRRLLQRRHAGPDRLHAGRLVGS